MGAGRGTVDDATAGGLALGFAAEHFNPADKGGHVDRVSQTVTFVSGESRYVYRKRIILAVNLALATERPLLVAGPAGGGKSTLASNVAAVLGRRFYKRVITSRTRASDLLWSFDALRRLSDAQVTKSGMDMPPRAAYVQPEVLWWAFDPDGAVRRGAAADDPRVPAAEPPDPVREARDAVVLLDEIDKAEPDVPNDLLVPLDENRFEILDLDPPVPVEAKRRVLTIITTNGERELPPAFMRRCVLLDLPPLDRDWLTRIADDRYGAAGHEFHSQVAELMMPLIETANKRRLRAPSTAEYLDTIKAYESLQIDGIEKQAEIWKQVRQAMLWKQDERELPADPEDAP